jgi:hypothetical protein
VLLDPESTGSLVVFAFHRKEDGEAQSCAVWVCRTETEAELVEELVGPIEPAQPVVWTLDDKGVGYPEQPMLERASCWLSTAEIPLDWLKTFPSGEEIVRKTVELRNRLDLQVDERILKRRDCEYELFLSVEEALELPVIRAGFDSLSTFVQRAQTILQRRKARSGRSLELHMREILKEEQLREGVDFQHQPESDPGKRPDFLFPNQAAYQDRSFPCERLRMLAAKTTCKDRWRQILNEAERIPVKHLLTLQEGISENQFREMHAAGVTLVVPRPLMSKYPVSVRHQLLSVEKFVSEVRELLHT